ncbi:hypothetical protein [Thauera sp. Sel9]|uniref:hypothetical protein n=1 Tax=Thauera sp. Sel9 TaxID=2974299 RepID=UPI0021E1303C|nr:hypothetical protein [Thauera sp. Sel9]MCV2217245.1 hypothetical protein [Thauera sp. Sel9]
MQPYLERDAFSTRLREALARVAPDVARPTALAREFNRRYAGEPVTLHATRKWLSGDAIPAQDKLRVLADWLGVSAEWLRFGAGNAAFVAREAEAVFDYQLMRDIAALSDAHQQVVRDLVKSLHQAETR